MATSHNATAWREDVQRLCEQIGEVTEAQLRIERRSGETAGARKLAEQLNQLVRRIRQSGSEDAVLSILTVGSTPFCDRVAAFAFNTTHTYSVSARGCITDRIQFETRTAPAVFTALETKDPVVAAASVGELSPELFEAAMQGGEVVERAYLFPLVVSGAVRAVLFAAGNVQSAPLELLAETAGMRLEALERERSKTVGEGLVQLAPTQKPGKWEDLSPAEQAVHLRAQRKARALVADLRLAHGERIRKSQAEGNIYRALKPEIDAAREIWRKEFANSSPAMVDYLYLELLGNLANNEERLLGPEFPGRLF
jgi:hypothetical protein